MVSQLTKQPLGHPGINWARTIAHLMSLVVKPQVVKPQVVKPQVVKPLLPVVAVAVAVADSGCLPTTVAVTAARTPLLDLASTVERVLVLILVPLTSVAVGVVRAVTDLTLKACRNLVQHFLAAPLDLTLPDNDSKN
jgi:hypothetical protein